MAFWPLRGWRKMMKVCTSVKPAMLRGLRKQVLLLLCLVSHVLNSFIMAVSHREVACAYVEPKYLLTTTNSSRLTSAWKCPLMENLWLPGMPSEFPWWFLWSRLWLRVLAMRTWPLWSVKRSTNECKEIDCYNSRGTANTQLIIEVEVPSVNVCVPGSILPVKQIACDSGNDNFGRMNSFVHV